VGLASSSPQPAGERQCLSGVAGGLVDPPDREVGHPRAQKNERRPGVKLATAELLDGARDQPERLVSSAGEGVGGAEGRSGGRPDDDLPRSTEVETALKGPGRAWEIPAAEVGAPEIEQPEVQREGMIGRFSDSDGGLGVPDRLVEPAELGEHVGEAGPRGRRRDTTRPSELGPGIEPHHELLVAQVALERDVLLEECGRLAEPAPGGVRHAQIRSCDHLDRAIAKGSRDTQGRLSESDGLVVVAIDQALVRHERGDPRQPVLVAERPGEPLRLVEVVPHARPIAEREERISEVQPDVDGQLSRLPCLGEAAEGPEGLL
jgi:hypothetical protein